jgi:hypothetical protein
VNAALPIDVSKGLKLDPARAREIGAALSGEYCFAEPFPHIVLDNFLPGDLVSGLLTHFPTKKLTSDVVFDYGYAGPQACWTEGVIGPRAAARVQALLRH